MMKKKEKKKEEEIKHKMKKRREGSCRQIRSNKIIIMSSGSPGVGKRSTSQVIKESNKAS